MTLAFEAPALAGAVFGRQRKGAPTPLAVAVAASVLLHLAALAIRLSSDSGGATEPIVPRPLAVRLISAAAAIPAAAVETQPAIAEPVRATPAGVAAGPREPPVATTEPLATAGPVPANPESTSRTGPAPSIASIAMPPKPSLAIDAPPIAGPNSPARPILPQPIPAQPIPAQPIPPQPMPPQPISPQANSSQPMIAASTTYRAAAGLDPPPRPLGDITPDFPTAAGTRGGTVVLRLLLSETGAVDKIEVVRANPPGLFESAALAAFGAARFSPGFLAGTPVRSQIMFEVEFAPQSRDAGVSSRGY